MFIGCHGVDVGYRLEHAIFGIGQHLKYQLHAFGVFRNALFHNLFLAIGQAEFDERIGHAYLFDSALRFLAFISKSLYLIDELPQFNTRIFIFDYRFCVMM